MTIWKRLLRAAARAETSLDALKYKLDNRLNSNTDISILTYMGYGTAKTLYLRGRVVQNRKVKSATDADSIWHNLLNTYRRLDSDEIPFAKVTATYKEHEQSVTADGEGYFEVLFQFSEPIVSEEVWQEIQLNYDDGRRQAQAVGRVLIPPPDAAFGVISDLDDTVMRTDVINLLKLARNTFLRNARTRLPFRGVAEFYAALQTAGDRFNPIFYVSNSPYNLYDLIADFIKLRGIPPGPIFLRDMGLTENYLLASHEHKYDTIERLLQLYPDLPFVLIGDSGEKDAMIYLQVVQHYPGRIKAVYIRDVEPHKRDTKRDVQVLSLAEQSIAVGVEMLLVADTAAAAQHALEKGLIAEVALSGIIHAAEVGKIAAEVETLIDKATDEQ